ncbi:cytochrome c family protein [Anaeromyxobacter sp. Fw109-5]|uniref:cytochrome c family protein n=1 Tax=Anaeromyxobacter sp. (strain Fw109-5) TaxID=404589 RepID=UPI001F1B43BC|nr:cytochrome c family protein [Anaeromyxobacter sp. Fw109-5]
MPAPVRLLLVCALALPAVALAGDRVGPETCKACHPAAYARWSAGPHARARESLPLERREDRRCLGCHAPDAADGISGVSCEACHGPGALYAASYVMRDPELSRALGLVEPGARSCGACHTESTPSLERFDPKKKLPLIEHWVEERKGR